MKVLISLLGLSPGVVTGAYYALYNGWGISQSVEVNKVITIGTSINGIDRVEDLIEREFERWCSSKKIEVQYDDTCRLHIENDELEDDKDICDFQRHIINQLETHKNDEVYLVVAGGRKSMAALAAIDIQLFGYSVQGLYHLYIKKELERDADHFWELEEETQQNVMWPPEGQCYLVEIPFIFIQEDGSLSIRGKVDSILEKALRARFARLDERGREKYWDYIFEVKAADYIRIHRKYPICVPNYRHPKLPVKCKEIDVYAESDNNRCEILVVECKLRHVQNPDNKPIDIEAVEQVIKRMKALRSAIVPHIEAQGKEVILKGWVICNANTASQEAKKLALQEGVDLFWSKLPRNWREGPQNWQIANLEQIPVSYF